MRGARRRSCPGVRGLARLGEAFALLPADQAQGAGGAAPVRGREGDRARWLASSALSAGISARRAGAAAGDELMVAVLGMAPTALALRDSQLAAYHGVEHKAIAGYEQGTDAADAAKEHDRCGSNLVAPMLISTVVGNVIVRSRARRARTGRRSRRSRSRAWRVSVEMFAWSERNRETPARAGVPPARATRCSACSRRASRPREQLDVGRAALAEILRLEAPAAPRQISRAFRARPGLVCFPGPPPDPSLSPERHGARMLPLAVDTPFIEQVQTLGDHLAAHPPDVRAGLPDLAHAEVHAADQAAADQAGRIGLDPLGRRRRLRRGQARAARGGGVPARPGPLQEARRKRSEGHHAARPARHRQDAAREGGGHRVRRTVLQPVRELLRRDVRRPRRRADPPAVRDREEAHARRSSSSTSSTRSGCSAASISRARRTRRSTSCWSRWTASRIAET